MTIPTAAAGTPIPRAHETIQFVDLQTGTLSTHGAQVLNAWREFIVGMCRPIACNASGKNLVMLTPKDASPIIASYIDHDMFVFVASETSDGAVTGTVVPRTGSLATIKFYVDGGASQAGAGDVVAGRIYIGIYNSQLDTGAGGLVLK